MFKMSVPTGVPIKRERERERKRERERERERRWGKSHQLFNTPKQYRYVTSYVLSSGVISF